MYYDGLLPECWHSWSFCSFTDTSLTAYRALWYHSLFHSEFIHLSLTPFTLSATFLTFPQTDIQLPPRTFFFFLHMKNSILFFPFLFSALLHTTYSRSHLQTTLECYLYCPGLGSCYSFPLLTKDVCSDLNFTKVQGCLESGLLAWTPLSAWCQHLGVDRSCLQLRQPDLQDANDQEKKKETLALQLKLAPWVIAWPLETYQQILLPTKATGQAVLTQLLEISTSKEILRV